MNLPLILVLNPLILFLKQILKIYSLEKKKCSFWTGNYLIFQKLSTKLAIPQINWEKLNEEKNKTNKLLSEQRKALNKEKTVSYWFLVYVYYLKFKLILSYFVTYLKIKEQLNNYDWYVIVCHNLLMSIVNFHNRLF